MSAADPQEAIASGADWLARSKKSGDSGDSGDSRASASDEPSPVGGDALGTVGTAGFSVSGGWVWYTPAPKPGEDIPAPERVCSELHVRGQTRDADGNAWGRLLEFPDREGRLHRWACPMRMLAGDAQEFRAVLLDMGLLIEPSAKARQRLAIYVQTTRTDRTVTCTERTGWHGDAFVLPDFTLGTGDVLLQTLGEPPKLRQSGSLERWRAEVAAPCVGNSRLVFTVSTAFAPPLLEITGDESGGIHLVGPSTTGKTTALHAAASVWGGPDYLHRWRATTNGLEGIAQTHNDLPLVLDELAQVDAREAGEIAYMLANGTGKHRARRDGLAKPAARWRLLFLSDGEIGLSEHMREAGKRTRAGQEVRLAEVPADAGLGHGLFEHLHGHPGGAALADAILAAIRTDHGLAGPAFLERLLATDRAEVRAGIETLRADFKAEQVPAGANGQAERVAKRFALVAAAGELATAWGITGWETGAAIHAAGVCFAAWLDRRGGTGSQEDAAALAQLRHFLELHGEARFSTFGDNARPTINRAGFRRMVEGVTQYLILPEVFRREVCAGFDAAHVARLLRERGFLETEPPHLTIKPRGSGRVYCVREGVME